jgi:hypothetical protein
MGLVRPLTARVSPHLRRFDPGRRPPARVHRRGTSCPSVSRGRCGRGPRFLPDGPPRGRSLGALPSRSGRGGTCAGRGAPPLGRGAATAGATAECRTPQPTCENCLPVLSALASASDRPPAESHGYLMARSCSAAPSAGGDDTTGADWLTADGAAPTAGHRPTARQGCPPYRRPETGGPDGARVAGGVVPAGQSRSSPWCTTSSATAWRRRRFRRA